MDVPVSELSVSILIPAFNEEGAIAETVETIRKQAVYFKELEIVVINDGSSDRTGEIARELPVTLIEHGVNRGYGAALKTGLQRARFEYILIADADGTYPLEEIPRLMADASAYDMVVGARTGEVVEVPLIRRPAKWIITRLAEYLSQQTIPDLNSGLRVFRKEVALHEDGRMELTVRMRLFPCVNQPDKPSVAYLFMVPAKLLDGTQFKALTGRSYGPKLVEGAFSADRKDGNLFGAGCRFIAFKSDRIQLVIDCNPYGLISESDYCCYGTPVGEWSVVKKGDSVLFSFGYPAVTYGGVFAGKVIFYTGEYDYPAKHFYQTWSYNGPTPALAQFTFGDRAQTKAFEKADCAAYDAKKGWGWENPAGLEALETESPDIVANCVSAADGKERTFLLDVTPGRYMVTVRAGHNTKEIGPFDIRLNGKPCAQGAHVEAGQTKTFVLAGPMRANDRQLRISFEGSGPWAVRSIVVQPIIYSNEDFTFDRGLWTADGLFSPEIE